MKYNVAVFAAAMFAAGAAVAGSIEPVLVEPVPAVAPAPMAGDWTGFYVGGSAGWMMGDDTVLVPPPPLVSPFDGLLYGGFAGYNYQMDSGLVLGAEVAAFTGTMEFTPPPNLGITLFDVKARVGYAAGDALVFASGGYTMATYDNGDEGAGWNLGVGVDYRVTDNIFIGGEYVYRSLTDTLSTPATWESRFGTVQARVGLRF